MATGSNRHSRRDVLIGTAAAAAVGWPAADGAAAAASALAPAAGLLDRTVTFLAGLDPAQRKAASFGWDGPTWRGWSYFGVSGYIKPGLRFEQMQPAQADAAWALFSEVLSPAGLEKARNVMLLQDILVADGNGVGQRSSQRFSVSVHGTPAPRGAFGVRLEGHHLSLSFAVRDGALVSVTPAAFAALPARVTKGPHAGLRTVGPEEIIARRLMADLAPPARGKAQVRDTHLFNILSSAGAECSNAGKVGLPAADMTAAQRDLLRELIETYAVTPYVGAAAATQRARVGDINAARFAWYGPNREETSFGYRIIGDRFVIELGCIDGAAQHIHPVYHDLGNVLGRVAA
jgi:hypothetical protein